VAIQDAYTPCSFKTADVLEKIAEWGIHEGRFVEPSRNLERVRRIQEGLGLKSDHSEVMRVKEELATLYGFQGLYRDAVQQIKDVITWQKSRLKPDDEKVLRLEEMEAAFWQHIAKRDRSAQAIAKEKSETVAQKWKEMHESGTRKAQCYRWSTPEEAE
jgi:hypothetical protein